MSAAEVLRKARALLTPEGAWTQGDYARDAIGREVGYLDPAATCFCTVGAVSAAASALGLNRRLGIDRLQEVLKWPHLPSWNDLPGRTQAEVLAAFDAAIAAAEAP